MANRYWVGGTETWNSTAGTKWATTSGGAGGAAIPLPTDDVFFDAASGNVTVSMNGTVSGFGRSCLNLNFTGFTGTIDGTSNINIDASLTVVSGMTWNHTGLLLFRATTAQNITPAGKTFRACTFNGVGGSWTLKGDLTLGSTNRLTITNGTLSAVDGGSNRVISAGLLTLSSGGTLTLGSATHLITGSGTTTWNNTGGTLSASSGTIKFTNASATGITFVGGGATYNNVWFDRGSSTATITLTGANTFAQFKDTGTAAHSIVFPNSTTTVTSWDVNGSSGNVITLSRTGGSGQFTLSDAGGTNHSIYLSISNSIATGGATWEAFTADGNTDGGNNSGWLFTAPPSFTASPLMSMMAQSGGLM